MTLPAEKRGVKAGDDIGVVTVDGDTGPTRVRNGGNGPRHVFMPVVTKARMSSGEGGDHGAIVAARDSQVDHRSSWGGHDRSLYGGPMDFSIPADIQALLDECDAFIDDVIKPMEDENDNIRFFDHRREDSRTDWDRDGLPNAEWEALLRRMRTAGRQGWTPSAITFPSASAAVTDRTSPWRSSASTLRAKGSVCTTTCRTSRSIVGNFADRTDDGEVRLRQPAGRMDSEDAGG